MVKDVNIKYSISYGKGICPLPSVNEVSLPRCRAKNTVISMRNGPKIWHFPKIETRQNLGCSRTKSLPSRELTYPTLGKGKASSKVIFAGIY